MTILKSISQPLAIGAQLALMAAISIGLATNTHQTSSNTSPYTEAEEFVSVPLPRNSPSPVPDVKPTSLDLAMNALTPRDAALYRAIFTAQDEGDWDKAEKYTQYLDDRRLVGSVLADRFTRLGASLEEHKAWLELFPTQPEARKIHAAALKQGGKNLPSPRFPQMWSGGGQTDSATSFNTEYALGKANSDAALRQLTRQIQKTLAQKKPEAALKLLEEARKKRPVSEAFVAEAKATISAFYFRAEDMGKAAIHSGAAAREDHPLGLWIRGLVAWRTGDYALAAAQFERLAAKDELSESNAAAARFWAYRSFDKIGNTVKARTWLHQAGGYPRSFYGLLAGQLLGKNPIVSLTKSGVKPPRWNSRHQEVLSEIPSGWRALALVQIGQAERAEAELRRINPQGDSPRREAMLALASFVPMPAIALQLAHLKTGKDYDPEFYPFPPWQPAGGFTIDRALLFALARHESLFDPMAVSSKGARGLMQIMPSTANYLIAKGRVSAEQGGKEALFDPTFNMTLGQSYVDQLTKLPHIGNNLVFLLAAYNGGPGNAMNWIDGRKDADPLYFLESIPSRETRQYIARVLPHYWAYRARLGKPLDTLDQLAQGQWPSVSLADKGSLRVATASNP